VLGLQVLQELLGSLGEGSRILPRFVCDYGAHIAIGAHSFVNYDAILLDCAPIRIGDHVQIGPRVQLLTALHPVDDYDARRQGWESAAPIVISASCAAVGSAFTWVSTSVTWRLASTSVFIAVNCSEFTAPKHANCTACSQTGWPGCMWVSSVSL